MFYSVLSCGSKHWMWVLFEHFWIVVWPQVTNKCYNIDVRILINAGTLAPSVVNWLPKFDSILFFSLGANTRP
jgi:hypothetical protein